MLVGVTKIRLPCVYRILYIFQGSRSLQVVIQCDSASSSLDLVSHGVFPNVRMEKRPRSRQNNNTAVPLAFHVNDKHWHLEQSFYVYALTE